MFKLNYSIKTKTYNLIHFFFYWLKGKCAATFLACVFNVEIEIKEPEFITIEKNVCLAFSFKIFTQLSLLMMISLKLIHVSF